MTDHGKCTTCGRDMHPAIRYGGLCWECHDAEGKRKDELIGELYRELKASTDLMKNTCECEAKMVAEIRVLRAALKLVLHGVANNLVDDDGTDEDRDVSIGAATLGDALVEQWCFSEQDADIIRRIFDD